MTIKFLQAVNLDIPLDPSSGGTGFDNGSFTLQLGGNTIISNGGSIVLGGFTVTILGTGAAVINDNTATAGHVGFFSSSFKLNNDANLFWDNTNKRLGIGNAAPSRPLHVTGTGRFTTGLELNWLTDAAVPYVSGAGTKLLDSSSSFTYNSADITLGIGGTSTIANTPRLAIKGTDSNGATGPHFQTNISSDIYPVLHFLSFTHDNIEMSWDAYYDGAASQWKSSDAGSNYQLRKNSDHFGIWSESGIAQGSVVTWVNTLDIELTGILNLPIATSEIRIAGTRVVDARKTGWALPTGTSTRTTFATSTVTTAQLAERVKALIEDLYSTAGHGLIGA